MVDDGSTLVAHAEPSKTFFIDMLSRDIALSVCILDLIDNSIHSLIEESGLDVSQCLIEGTAVPRIKAQIDISCTPSTFRISDNCGGVSIKEAEEQVFLFGNNPASKAQAGLGFYGIGMKRAFFKLGRNISFESHTTTEELKIDIDVDDWSKRPEWEFPFTYARRKTSSSGGTEIEITS